MAPDRPKQNTITIADSDDIQPVIRDANRLRYADDVEAHPGRGRRSQLARRGSNSSLSIRSLSRSRIVDPGLVLPTTYRTL
jgi:hypothetical protein